MKPNKKIPIPVRQIVLWILSFILLVSIYSRMGTANPIKVMDYSEFKSKVAAGEILSVSISPDTIEGTYKNNGKEEKFKAVKIEDNTLVPELISAKIPFKGQADKSWVYSILFKHRLDCIVCFGVVVFIYPPAEKRRQKRIELCQIQSQNAGPYRTGNYL